VKGSRLQWLVSWRVLAALGLLAALAALFGVHSLQKEVEARAQQGAIASAQIIVSLVVARNITDRDIETLSISAVEQEDMDADLAVLRQRGQVVDLEVWSRADGRMVYTDSRGPGALTAERLSQARRGTVVGSTDRSGQRALDVFISYDADGGTQYRAVVEVQIPSDPIDESVRVWTFILYSGAAAAVALAFTMAVVLRRRYRRREYGARHDALTGLGNRLLLAEVTEGALTAGRPAAMLVLDLDGFKEINDTLGHDAGDRVLATVADRLRTCGVDAAALVRLGSDEFAVLLCDPGAKPGAVAAGERIRLALRQPIVVSGLPVEIEASVGVALAPQHGSDLITLLKRADVAMYDAKRSGTGVAVYDLATDSREARHLSVLAELRQGIGAGELRLFYQPKCRPDGRIDEVEALVRWQHPTRGLLAPDAFVPLAERTSIIKPLTAWVLQEAARQGAVWRAQGREVGIAVNVSARNLVDDQLIATVTDAAAAAGIPVGLLSLEVTETAVMTDPVRVVATLEKLSLLGVQIAIDDFGVGYTSLSYLTTLPVHALKIDRRFITDLLTNPLDEIIVRNVINLARDLGLTSVAEGVESAEIWQRLTDLGCAEIQGYVLTRPLPPADFDRWRDRWQPETPVMTAGVRPSGTPAG
jgi:diguanylate cyclase (GGDEF)-like protein